MSFLLGFLLFVAINARGQWFDRVFMMMFENHSYDEVAADPNFNYYFSKGTNMMNYFAITHPSQPNYWCQIGGDHFGINSDGNVDLPYSNLVDLFDKKQVTWKSYQEDYPGNCNADESVGLYYRKHNPFISFNNIRTNATRCANIVNAKQLDVDLAKGTLPELSYFTPNIDNDAHNTNISYAGQWLHSFLIPRLPKFPARTLFIVTWDEDDYTEENQIFTAVWGSMIKPNSKDHTFYDHYSLLRTIEDNWGLGNLGRNDANATPFFGHSTATNFKKF